MSPIAIADLNVAVAGFVPPASASAKASLAPSTEPLAEVLNEPETCYRNRRFLSPS